MKSKQIKTGKQIEQLRSRVLQLERAVLILCTNLQQTSSQESILDYWSKRRRHLDNSTREIKAHLKRYGNEFDKPPYVDPKDCAE